MFRLFQHSIFFNTRLSKTKDFTLFDFTFQLKILNFKYLRLKFLE